MKLLAIVLCLVLSACGKEDPDKNKGACETSSGLGAWHDVNTFGVITLFGNCSIESTYSCSPTMSFTSLTGSTGTTTLSFNQTTAGTSCIPSGSYSCTYVIFNNTMQVNCTGIGILDYIR